MFCSDCPLLVDSDDLVCVGLMRVCCMSRFGEKGVGDRLFLGQDLVRHVE